MAVRLSSHMVISALIRHAAIHNIATYVRQKGDATSGAIYVSDITSSDKATLYALTTDLDGNRFWMSLTGDTYISEVEIDSKIVNLCQNDPDAWVLEVELSQGKYNFKECAF